MHTHDLNVTVHFCFTADENQSMTVPGNHNVLHRPIYKPNRAEPALEGGGVKVAWDIHN